MSSQVDISFGPQRVDVVNLHGFGILANHSHTPLTFAGEHTVARAELNNVRWVSHCRDLVKLPVAA